MSQTIKKSAAQTLFDRIMVTWIYPEVERRVEQGIASYPFNLLVALIVWEDRKKPTILLNNEADDKIVDLPVTTKEPTESGKPVNPANIVGLNGIKLIEGLRNFPFIFLILGGDEKYFILSKRMSVIVGNKEFSVLYTPLATEGVRLSPSNYHMDVYIDLIRNGYEGMPASVKRETAIRLAETHIQRYKQKAKSCVKRHLRLPALNVHNEDELLPLLYEARQTYIDGYFFSCIASTATTADRICNRLSARYSLPIEIQELFLGETFGNKPQKLRAEGVITKDQEALLMKINKIRNRHIHPRRTISQLTLKRDAFVAVCLLHELIEGTFSIMRDHTFHEGRIVPKPLL